MLQELLTFFCSCIDISHQAVAVISSSLLLMSARCRAFELNCRSRSPCCRFCNDISHQAVAVIPSSLLLMSARQRALLIIHCRSYVLCILSRININHQPSPYTAVMSLWGQRYCSVAIVSVYHCCIRRQFDVVVTSRHHRRSCAVVPSSRQCCIHWRLGISLPSLFG
jgi:hypothetical protein